MFGMRLMAKAGLPKSALALWPTLVHFQQAWNMWFCTLTSAPDKIAISTLQQVYLIRYVDILLFKLLKRNLWNPAIRKWDVIQCMLLLNMRKTNLFFHNRAVGHHFFHMARRQNPYFVVPLRYNNIYALETFARDNFNNFKTVADGTKVNCLKVKVLKVQKNPCQTKFKLNIISGIKHFLSSMLNEHKEEGPKKLYRSQWNTQQNCQYL